MIWMRDFDPHSATANSGAPAAVEEALLFEPANIIDLVFINSSDILSISLYSGRAEVKRLYKFSVKTGQNEVNINGLHSVLDRHYFRVEGRASGATIRNVTLSDIPKVPVPSTSDLLDESSNEKDLAERALERASKAKTSLEAYIATFNVHTDVDIVDMVLDHHDIRSNVLDQKIHSLEKKLKGSFDEIKDEQTKLSGTPRNEKLGVRAAVGVFVASEGEVEIVLIYEIPSDSSSELRASELSLEFSQAGREEVTDTASDPQQPKRDEFGSSDTVITV